MSGLWVRVELRANAFLRGPLRTLYFLIELVLPIWDLSIHHTRHFLKTQHRQDSSCLIQNIHTGDICASLSLPSFVTMKGNKHFYSALSWLILDISFRARWIMPWMCQFPCGAKARLDNQFVCSDESHVAGTDRFVLWSGWMWAVCGSKSYIILWRVLCSCASVDP